jgi:ABC-type branched-subunit amino acid transport system ATPase component
LTVKSGQIAGLIGPNGSGKTTLFNCVCGYYQPSQGHVLLEGRDITRIRPHRAAVLGIGRTFQSPNLFREMSLRENLILARESIALSGSSLRGLLPVASSLRADSRTEELLDRLGLHNHAEARPGELPVGLAKLGDLGRALATGPKLLLLDEPAVGLNDAERERLIYLLRELRDITMLIVDHNISFVTSLCETITVLAAGSVISVGSPAHIRADPLVIQAYLGDEQ